MDTQTFHQYIIVEHLILKPKAIICYWAAGICFHLATRALMESATNVGTIRPGSQTVFKFLPKVLDAVGVGALGVYLNNPVK